MFQPSPAAIGELHGVPSVGVHRLADNRRVNPEMGAQVRHEEVAGVVGKVLHPLPDDFVSPNEVGRLVCNYEPFFALEIVRKFDESFRQFDGLVSRQTGAGVIDADNDSTGVRLNVAEATGEPWEVVGVGVSIVNADQVSFDCDQCSGSFLHVSNLHVGQEKDRFGLAGPNRNDAPTEAIWRTSQGDLGACGGKSQHERRTNNPTLSA